MIQFYLVIKIGGIDRRKKGKKRNTVLEKKSHDAKIKSKQQQISCESIKETIPSGLTNLRAIGSVSTKSQSEGTSVEQRLNSLTKNGISKLRPL